jgi:hypothetical protein
MYLFFPLLAFAGDLASGELVARCRAWTAASRESRVWTCVCVAGAVHLAVSTWGWTMVFYGARPYVLSDQTLVEHYDAVTRHKPSYPLYSTTAAAAARVRALAAPGEPIACLINEPRLYWLAGRPPVHRMIVPNPMFGAMFPEFVATIEARRPGVVLARVPETVRGSDDSERIETAVFDEVVRVFGAEAEGLRERYALREVIGEIGLLTLRAAP